MFPFSAFLGSSEDPNASFGWMALSQLFDSSEDYLINCSTAMFHARVSPPFMRSRLT
jgi:hypothetical protein